MTGRTYSQNGQMKGAVVAGTMHGVQKAQPLVVVSGSEWVDDIEWSVDDTPILGAAEAPEVCEVCT